METTHWGLKTSEWIMVAAILVGPLLAILTQIWIEARKNKRDQKLWVFGQLMSLRATWLHPDFVRAINFVDVIYYKNKNIRDKLGDFLNAIKSDMANQQLFDKAKDLFSEMLAMMGKELKFQFAHTEIKDTAYYPKGHAFMDEAAVKLREKALAVLDGKANIGVIVHEPVPEAAGALPPPPMHLLKKFP